LLNATDTALRYATEFARGERGSRELTRAAAAAIERTASDTTSGEGRARSATARSAATAAAHAAAAAGAVDTVSAAGTAADAAVAAARAAAGAAVATASPSATAVAARVAARRDHQLLREQLKGHPGIFQEGISPSERGFLGSYWPDEPPKWYTELEPQLRDALAELAGKPADDAELRRQLDEKQERVTELQAVMARFEKETAETGRQHDRELESLRESLATAEQEAVQFRQQHDKRLEDAEQRRLRLEEQVEKLNAELSEEQKQIDEERRLRREAERAKEDAERAKTVAEEERDENIPQKVSWWTKQVLAPKFIFSFMVFAFLAFIVVMVLFGIAEIRSRQKLELLLTTRIGELQQRLTANDAQGASDVRASLDRLDDCRQRLQMLTSSGADRESETLRAIRCCAHSELWGDADEAAAASFSNEPLYVLWRFWRPDYMSSDLLLALVVTISGTIGAIITVVRNDNDRGVRPKDLAFGVAAGFITLLAIRGGKSAFLLRTEEVSFVFNPYSSAFLGLLAGLFTDKAFDLLRGFANKLVKGLQTAFDLDGKQSSTPQKSLSTPTTAEASPAPSKPAESTEDEPTTGG